MPVYVDGMRAQVGRMKMCHMVADSMAELLDMADKIGVDRKWFQPSSHPHFDICLSKRAQAIAHGARQVDRKGLVSAMKRHREKFKADPKELSAIRRAAGMIQKESSDG